MSHLNLEQKTKLNDDARRTYKTNSQTKRIKLICLL